MTFYQQLNRLQIFMKFSIGILYKNLLNEPRFHKNQLSDGHTLKA